MFGRVFLGIITVISLLWVGYATFDRVNQGKQFQPEYIFGDADGELIIINNPEKKEALLNQIGITNNEISTLITNLYAHKIARIYVSKKRGHVFIEAKEELTAKSIHSLFFEKTYVKVDNKAVVIDKFKGSYSKNTLYLSIKDYHLNKESWSTLFDKNADGSIIQFTKQQPTVTDIYIKENGIIEYKSAIKSAVGVKVNDSEVFASVVPSSVTSYTFYETDYLRYSNPEFLNSPMNNWLKYGVVHLAINNQEALITDYIDGQEPIQVLYDFLNKESSDTDNDYFEGINLIQFFQNAKGLYVYQLDDFVVISPNRSTCETIVGDYKLGNTLTQHPNRFSEIYSRLPQKVNFREVNKTTKQSISVYDNNLLTTIVGGKSEVSTSTQDNSQLATSFVIGGIARDILMVDEKSFFVTTENKVVFFEDDKKKWEQMLDGNSIGEASIIDIYANEKSQLLITTDKKVYVFDVNGGQPGGFPIELGDETAIQSTVIYRWKGNGHFLVPVNNGRMVQYDNQGRELTIIRTQLAEIEQQPVVWVSANKLFFGVYGNGKFEMIQAENRKSLRVFDAKNSKFIIKLPNEVKLFGINNNQLISYDQRGGLTQYEKFLNATLIPTIFADKGIVVKDQQTLKLFNSNGLVWGTIKLPFADLSDVQIYTTTSGATFIATIDGLENKVYLWKSNGEMYSKKQFDGSRIVRYHNGYIYTVIDNLVARYAI